MAIEPGTTNRYRSALIGGAAAATEHGRPGAEGADDPVTMLIELNLRYRGSLADVTRDFFALWVEFGLRQPSSPQHVRAGQPAEMVLISRSEPASVPVGLRRVTDKLYQAQLTDGQCHQLLAADRERSDPDRNGQPTVIFRVWPDYTIYTQIDRSAPTVKANAAWRSYAALGKGAVWAVIDSGIDGHHPHFAALELAVEAGALAGRAPVVTAGLHRDFTDLVTLSGNPPPGAPSPLTDEQGHGSHVAGIIAGCTPEGSAPHVATSAEPPAGGGFVQRQRVNVLSGMAPSCELISLKVMRLSPTGVYITSSAAVIAALDYLRTQVNVVGALPRVHGANLSLGCPWDPTHYAAGQSPLSQTINQLVDSGVVVVVSSGNGGGSQAGGPANTTGLLSTITEPAHAENCIAVGSTHREAPHVFGISWTSGKGPTLDGRLKPDVVAPGEWITSVATGDIRAAAGLNTVPAGTPDALLTYAEQSGTSMAAPHVSGVVAAFLSARPEFIGRPREVKRLLTDNATDLGRERYAQGAGLVDLMRMLSNA